MATPNFEWTQPLGGAKIIWRPLKVGDHIDLESNYSRSDTVHLKRFAELAARIISVDGKTKAELQKDDLGIIREWEDYDLAEFQNEISSREIARAVALSPQRPGGVVSALEQSVAKLQHGLNELSSLLTATIQKAKETEQKLGPLK